MTVTTSARQGAMLALALAWFACAAPAVAQQPSPSAVATARELLQVKGATSMFDPIIPGIVENTKNLILPTNPGLYKDVTDVATKLRNELAPRRNEVVDQIARMYAQRFTEAEMKEIIAFYKSPTGRKFVAEEPPIIDRGLQQAEEWSKKMADEVMAKFRAEMKKKGHDL
jgi:hypothetical protein